MNSKIILLLLFLFAFGCGGDKQVQPFSINKLYVGYSSLAAFKNDKKDSAKYYTPPPPPVNEEIAKNNIIEAKNGRIYFYNFSPKQKVDGYLKKNSKYNLNPYESDYDTLSAKSLKFIDSNNVDSIVKEITNGQKPIFVSIGIQKDTSTNKILLKITTSLYRNSVNIDWKVRKIINKENYLLDILSGQNQ